MRDAPSPASSPEVLGAVLAGGRSQRYGEDKAFVTVGGLSLVRRAASVMKPVTRRVVLVANDLRRYRPEGFDVRPDVRPGVGALGGVHTAVSWAREEGMLGALVVACDMPFVPPALLAELVRRMSPAAVVAPQSHGPRGLEPLCAVYGVGCLGAIEEAMQRGDRAVISFFAAIELRLLDMSVVEGFGDPATMFFNVNRPEDRSRAEAMLADMDGSAAGSGAEEVMT